jgi:hypothetical protein
MSAPIVERLLAEQVKCSRAGPADVAALIRDAADTITDLLAALEEVLDATGFLGGGDWELEGYGISTERGAEIRALYNKARGAA